MNPDYISSDWMDEFHLWLTVCKINFMELPWTAIVITMVGLFIVSAILVKPASPLGTMNEKEKFPFSQVIIAGLTLIGNLLGQVLNSLGFISHVQHMCGITLIHGRIPMATGVAYGSFILVTHKKVDLNKGSDNSNQQILPTLLVRHELGHTR